MGLERMSSLILVVILLVTIDVLFRVIHGSESIRKSLVSDSFENSTSSEADVSLVSHKDIPAPANVIRDSVSSEVNPHWDKSQCSVCHHIVTDSSSNSLKSTDHIDHNKLCLDCHNEDVSHIYIHPVSITVPKTKISIIKDNWNGNLRLDEHDRLTCLTCHDLLDQCLPERSHQAKLNPGFLRGGPYPNRYSLCYRCHDSKYYERNNAHEQISDNRSIKIKKCRLCHEVNTNQHIEVGIEKNLEDFPLLKNMDEDRTLLCIRCHQKIDHPSSAFRVKSDKKYRHLVRIDNDKLDTLTKQNKETGIKLPIEPNTGRIYCGTCHQPHQPGVFHGEILGPATMYNHRLRSTPICKHCHALYGSITDTGK